jgi:hypothetical protein
VLRVDEVQRDAEVRVIGGFDAGPISAFARSSTQQCSTRPASRGAFHIRSGPHGAATHALRELQKFAELTGYTSRRSSRTSRPVFGAKGASIESRPIETGSWTWTGITGGRSTTTSSSTELGPALHWASD